MRLMKSAQHQRRESVLFHRRPSLDCPVRQPRREPISHFDRQTISMAIKTRITPNLWCDDQAEPVVQLYTSIFRNSRITNVARYSKAGFETHQRPAGSVMTVAFELEGQPRRAAAV
jgi:3-demethylubiquinone-9 3-methyltransferase